jgi:hypothetical protein
MLLRAVACSLTVSAAFDPVRVEDAGSAEADGVYRPTGVADGAPRYRKGDLEILRDHGAWVLARPGRTLYYGDGRVSHGPYTHFFAGRSLPLGIIQRYRIEYL